MKRVNLIRLKALLLAILMMVSSIMVPVYVLAESTNYLLNGSIISNEDGSAVIPSTTPHTPITIEVYPQYVSVRQGDTIQFIIPTIADEDNFDNVSWSIYGNSSTGTYILNNGLLAIAEDETASELSVVATYIYDSAVFSSANVAILRPDTLATINVLPQYTYAWMGDAIQFFAEAATGGGYSQDVFWDVYGNNSIDTYILNSGLLMIAENETAKELTVIGTCTYDSAVFSTALVTISEQSEILMPITIDVSPQYMYSSVGDTIQFDAGIITSIDITDTISWSVYGNNSINTYILDDGMLVIAECETANRLRILATIYNNKAYSNAFVTILHQELMQYDIRPAVVAAELTGFMAPMGNIAPGSIAISNIAGLDAIRNNLNGTFHLVNNIDLNTTAWSPIGTQTQPFTGTLDGRGFAVRSLSIPTIGNQLDGRGLFGSTSGATIRNIAVYGNIGEGTGPAGGIVGRGTATINNSYANVNISSGSTVGGIIGTSGHPGQGITIITNSFNLGNIRGVTPGGIIGSGGVNISNSYNVGNITGTSNVAGGIAGSGFTQTTISNSFNVGHVSIDSISAPMFDPVLAGGLVGNGLPVMISNSYNIGSIFIQATPSNRHIGGIIGGMGTGIGTPPPPGPRTNTFWNRDSSQVINGVIVPIADRLGIGNSTDNTIGLTNVQMQTEVAFQGFDFAETWHIHPTSTYRFPMHQVRYARDITTNRPAYNPHEEVIVTVYVPSRDDTWFRTNQNAGRFGLHHSTFGVLNVTGSYDLATRAATFRFENPLNQSNVNRTDTITLLRDGIPFVNSAGNTMTVTYTNNAISREVTVFAADRLHYGPFEEINVTATVVSNFADSWFENMFNTGQIGLYHNIHGSLDIITASYDISTDTATFVVENPLNITGSSRTDTITLYISGNSQQRTISYENRSVVWVEDINIIDGSDDGYMYFTGGIYTFMVEEVDVNATFRDVLWEVDGVLVTTILEEDEIPNTAGLMEFIDDNNEIATKLMINPRGYFYPDGGEISITARTYDSRFPANVNPATDRVYIRLSNNAPHRLTIDQNRGRIVTDGRITTIHYRSPRHDEVVGGYRAYLFKFIPGQYDAQHYLSNEHKLAEISSSNTNISINTEFLEPGEYFVYIYYMHNDRIFYDVTTINVIPRPIIVRFDRASGESITGESYFNLSWDIESSGANNSFVDSVTKNGSNTAFNKTSNGVVVPLQISVGLWDEYVIVVTATDTHGQTRRETFTFNVFNQNALSNSVSSSITINNAYLVSGSSNDDIWNMRHDLRLLDDAIINVDQLQWSALDDRLSWHIADENIAEIHLLNASGHWRLVDGSSLISPFTPIRVVGVESGSTTVTVTHVRTGSSVEIPVNVSTLEDKLYLIRIVPGQPAKITFTNGNNVTRTIDSSSGFGLRGLVGEIAIYEPSGIISDVFIQSDIGEDRWVGIIRQDRLVSGETSTGLLINAPIELTLLSSITLYTNIIGGGHYVGDVEIRGGLFRNGTFIPESEINLVGSNAHTVSSGDDGRIFIHLDTNSFGQISVEDEFRYIFEVRFLDGNFAPLLVELDAFFDRREAISSTALHMFLQQWDSSRPTVFYQANLRDVTNRRIPLGPTSSDTTVDLVIRSILPYGKNLHSAQIRESGGARAIPTGQQFLVFDPPFPTMEGNEYAEIRWTIDRNTLLGIIPLGGQSSFEILFTYVGGTTQSVRIPFDISNMVGVEAIGLTIPVNWEVNTAILTGYRNAEGLRAPSVNFDYNELDFDFHLIATDDPTVYNFRAVIGGDVTRSVTDRYRMIRQDIWVQRNLLDGLSFPPTDFSSFQKLLAGKYKPKAGGSVSLNVNALGLMAFVSGELRWNSETNTFDTLVTGGDMIGQSSISLDVSVKFPVWKKPPIFVKFGVETGVFSQVGMSISDSNEEIFLRADTGIFDKNYAALDVSIIIANAGIKGYGKSQFEFQAATLYNTINTSSVHARRLYYSHKRGFEWFASALWIINASGPLGTSATVDSRTWAFTPNQDIFGFGRNAHNSLNALDMRSFNESFMLPHSMRTEQGVATSSLPNNPWGGIVAGDSSFAVVAWENINERIDEEWLEEFEYIEDMSYEDIISVMNQFEIYVSIFDGNSWLAPLALTDDFGVNISPLVATYNGRAVVVWQHMLSEYYDGNIETFVELWYSKYNGNVWSSPAMIDSFGESLLTGVQIDMNDEGFAVIITTGVFEDIGYDFEVLMESSAIVYLVTSTEIYSHILSGAQTTNLTPQIAATKDGFYLAWYSFSEDTGNDIIVRKINNNGNLLPAISVFEASSVSFLNPTTAYKLVGGDNNRASIITRSYDFSAEGHALYSLFLQSDGNQLTVSAPILLVAPTEGYLLEITGGKLIGNEIIVEYAKFEMPDDPLEDVAVYIHYAEAVFTNDFIGGAFFNNIDVWANEDVLVNFGIVNFGVDPISSVTIEVNSQVVEISNVEISPGVLELFEISVRTSSPIQNVPYSITVEFLNDEQKTFSDVLVFTKPDISIGQVTTLVEERGERLFSVQLYNNSDVFLADSGNEVRISFYEDPMFSIPLSTVKGQAVIYSQRDLTLLDEGGLNLQFTYAIPLGQLVYGEIPALGHRIYMRAALWNGGVLVEERCFMSNEVAVTFDSLIGFGRNPVTVFVDTVNTENGTIADLRIYNLSMQPLFAESGIVEVSLLDASGTVIEVINVYASNDIYKEDVERQVVEFAQTGWEATAKFIAGGTVLPVAPTMVTNSLPDALIREPYRQNLITIGDRPMSWRIIGESLPNGMSLTENVIEGIPTTVGNFTFTVEAFNDAGYTVQTLSINITTTATIPAITTVSLPDGMIGVAYNQQLMVSGTAPIIWNHLQGNFPDGLTLSPDGVISGVPTTTGEFNFTVGAENEAGYDTSSLLIIISQVPDNNIAQQKPFPETITNIRDLDAPTGMVINNTVVSWNAVNNALGYRVYVENRVRSSAIRETSFDLASLNLSAGNHAIQIRAIGDNVSFTNSRLSSATNFVVYTKQVLPTPQQNHNNIYNQILEGREVAILSTEVGSGYVHLYRDTLDLLVSNQMTLRITQDIVYIELSIGLIKELAGLMGDSDYISTINIQVYKDIADNRFVEVEIAFSIGDEELLEFTEHYTMFVNLTSSNFYELNTHRITTIYNNRNIGGYLDSETKNFSINTNKTGSFAIAYIENLRRIAIQLDSPEILDLAENASPQFMDVLPVIQYGRTLLPVRFVAYALGADVDWTPSDENNSIRVTITLGEATITFEIGKIAHGMDVPAQIIGDRTMVPLRFISEFFGATVSWDEETRGVEIVR